MPAIIQGASSRCGMCLRASNWPQSRPATATDRVSEYFFVSPDWKTLFVSHRKQNLKRVEQAGKRATEWILDGDVSVWSLDTGKLDHTYKHSPPRAFVAMQLSRDGRRFITFEELSGIRDHPESATSVWDVRTGQHRSLPSNISWGFLSSDGRMLAASVSDEKERLSSLKLYDLGVCSEKWSVPQAPRSGINSFSFSPDGSLLVAGRRSYPPGQKKIETWDSDLSGTRRQRAKKSRPLSAPRKVTFMARASLRTEVTFARSIKRGG